MNNANNCRKRFFKKQYIYCQFLVSEAGFNHRTVIQSTSRHKSNYTAKVLVHHGSLFQFKMVSMRSEKPIRAPPRLSRFPNVAFETGITTVDVSHRLAHKSYVVLTTHIGPEPRLTVTLTGWSQKNLTFITNR